MNIYVVGNSVSLLFATLFAWLFYLLFGSPPDLPMSFTFGHSSAEPFCGWTETPKEPKLVSPPGARHVFAFVLRSKSSMFNGSKAPSGTLLR